MKSNVRSVSPKAAVPSIICHPSATLLSIHSTSLNAKQVWRYFLLSNRPESADTDFKWADLAAKNNNELLANLGNFINRALSFLATKWALSCTVRPCHPLHRPCISWCRADM